MPANHQLVNNFVDERFELVALVFRLAENPEYNQVISKYQRKLNRKFNQLKDHPIVEYKKQSLLFGYDAGFGLAIHLEKSDDRFLLVDNIDFITSYQNNSRWTSENANEFVALLNDFYTQSKFSDFFLEHTKLYQKYSLRFKKFVLNNFSFEWFEKYGLKPEQIRVILSPSISNCGYGGTVFGASSDKNTVYAGLACSILIYAFEDFPVHEFVHAIAYPIAEALYAENEAFRNWCDDSVDIKRMPYYSDGNIMAHEYVTRAYTILYFVENRNRKLPSLLREQKGLGFPHIEQVYELITDKT